MRYLFMVLAMCGLFVASSCSKKVSKRVYTGPEVTQIFVSKKDRKLHLLHNAEVLKTYNIDLGFAPEGHKQFEGDGRTPEGAYFIDRRNPRSDFHLSLGISYPNTRDVAFAKEQGRPPGGQIFIHGARRKKDPRGPDWTAGCISVKNKEIEEIWLMVQDGTPIYIR